MMSNTSKVRGCTATALGMPEGASAWSTIRQERPYRLSSQAIVSPVGPAPTTRTSSGRDMGFIPMAPWRGIIIAGGRLPAKATDQMIGMVECRDRTGGAGARAVRASRMQQLGVVLLSILVWLTHPIAAPAGEPVTIAKLLADPQPYHLKVIAVQGTALQVQILQDKPGSNPRLDFQCYMVHPPYTFVLADETGFLQISVAARPPCVSQMSPQRRRTCPRATRWPSRRRSPWGISIARERTDSRSRPLRRESGNSATDRSRTVA